MAIRHECDGCGSAIQGSPERRGFVKKRDYCAACTAIADALQADLDKVHNRLAAEWKREVAALRSQYGNRLLLLPDMERPE